MLVQRKIKKCSSRLCNMTGFRTIFIFLLALLFIGGFQTHLNGQDKVKMGVMQDSINQLVRRMQNGSNDSIRRQAGLELNDLVFRTLSIPGSFKFPFDSLKRISHQISPDQNFRIFTWNIPLGDGTNSYSGVIQMRENDKGTSNIILLKDRSDTIMEPATTILEKGSWYGAIYYKILLTEFQGTRYYTLLGWDGLNTLINQKIIEILTFDDNDQPRFGKKMFRNYGNDNLARIIFKFAATVSMLVNYDEQYLPQQKKWDPGKKRFEVEQLKAMMIVCDELIPQEPQMEGLFEYYIPAADTFNGFLFQNGTWNFIRNIDARNK